MARDPRRDVIAGAATRVVDILAADPAFVALVAEAEVDRRIAAGELLPVQSLNIGGLELVPVGVVAELRAQLLALAEHPKVKKIRDLADMLAVCRALAGVAPEPAVDVDPEPAVEPQPAAEANVVAADRRRRPRGMPDLPQRCVVCQADLDEKQLAMSWTRHRAAVCADDMATYDAA